MNQQQMNTVLERIYPILSKRAEYYARQSNGTLEPSDLCHEAVIKLCDDAEVLDGVNDAYLVQRAKWHMSHVVAHWRGYSLSHVRLAYALSPSLGQDETAEDLLIDEDAETIEEEIIEASTVRECQAALDQAPLNSRARTIMQLLARGKSQKEIAAKYGYNKSGVSMSIKRSRAALIQFMQNPTQQMTLAFGD